MVLPGENCMLNSRTQSTVFTNSCKTHECVQSIEPSKNGIVPLEAGYYWKTRCRSTEMATLSFTAVSNKYLKPETREIDGQNIQLQKNTLLFSLCLDWLWITAGCIFCSLFQITDVVERSPGRYNLIIIVSVWPQEVSGKRLYNLIFWVTLG